MVFAYKSTIRVRVAKAPEAIAVMGLLARSLCGIRCSP